MTDEWKWRVGIDTEPASRSLEDLAQKAQTADDVLLRIAESVERLEQAFATLNKTGGFGDIVQAVNLWGEAIGGSLDQVITKLGAVQSTISRVGRESRDAAGQGAIGWGQGATAVERYSERLAEAELNLAKVRREATYFGAKLPTLSAFPGGRVPLAEQRTVEDLIPSLQEYERLLSKVSEKVVMPPEPQKPVFEGKFKWDQARIDRYREWEEQARGAAGQVYESVGVQSKEAQAYVQQLEEVAALEGKVAQLTQLEAREREKVMLRTREQAAAQAQVAAASPQGKMTSFFTEPQQSEWGTKFGLGDMTGFEQSMLRVLTTFDQLRAVGQQTQASFVSIVEVLRTLQTMKFQGIGTSLRVNIRTRLEESISAANLLIQTLARLDAMRMGEKPSATEVVKEGPVAPRTRMGYWARQAGAPTAAITELSTISAEVAKVWDTAPEGAARASNRIIAYMETLKQKLVGGSIVPDMVRDINRWLGRIGGMGSLTGIDQIGQKFLDVQRQFQEMSLVEQGGLPGFGPERQEVISQWVTPYRAQLQQAQQAMAGIMQQADPSQYQRLTAPTGQVVPVTPGFAMKQSQKEMAEYQARLKTLTSTEAELAAASDKVATALFAQGKQVKTKAMLLEELSKGTINAEKAEEQLGEMTEGVEEATERTSALASRFMRHITWIFQGIVIWGGIRAIQDWAKQFAETFGTVEMAAVHAAFIVRGSVEEMMAVQRQYANIGSEYGAGPGEAAQVVPVAERYGMSSPEVAEYAAQLAMVTGEEMDMAEATDTLLSVMRQWNIGADDTVRVLNTLSTMYASTPGELNDFLELMREGPGIAEQMGQSFEENMLLVSRAMSYLPGRTATTVSGTMGRMLSRIYRQDAARQLAQDYGISVYESETLGRRPGLEVLDEVARKFQEISSQSERAALAEMVAGTRGQAAWRDAYVMLDNWTSGISGAQTELREWGDLVEGVRDTHNTAVDEMSASWQTYTQILGETSGVIQGIDDAIRGLSDRFQEGAKYMALMERAEIQGYGRGDLYGRYEAETGRAPISRVHYEGGPAMQFPALTQEFMEWLDSLVSNMPDPASGAALRQWERGISPTMDTSADTLSRKIAEAGQNFEDSVARSGEDFHEALLLTMLATGWTPGAGIVDLTGPKDSPYTMSQINKAMQESRADTQRMISSYREFLQGQGLGGEAIEDAMKNFTDKLIMQLQFFRLPGGQIRLMEGRDLLFYLSQIEENTRPLEGIWNVPEGMRVWVPIESTFYGNWRDRQGGEGEDGDQVLDTTAFDAAVSQFGSHVDNLAVAGSAWAVMGQQYPTMEEGGTVWDQRMSDFFKWMDFLTTGPTVDPDQPYMGYVGAAERSGVNFDRFGVAVDKFDVAVNTLSKSFTIPMQSSADVGPKEPGGAEPGSAPPGPEIYLPLLLKGMGFGGGIGDLFRGLDLVGRQEVDVQVPEPLGVSVPVGEISQGVAIGTMNTGMPMSMNAMQMSMSSLGSSISSQLFYLMQIASNTAQAPIINVTGGGSASVGPKSPTAPADALSLSFAMSHMSGVVPV